MLLAASLTTGGSRTTKDRGIGMILLPKASAKREKSARARRLPQLYHDERLGSCS
jgi:hypothetical protein